MSRIDVGSHSFSGAERLFFDANIWLFLYGPTIGYRSRQISLYADAWKRIRRAKSAVYIDALVISEFINRFSRLEYDQTANMNQRYRKFKDFRKSPDFQPIANDIASQVQRILAYAHQCGSCFESIDLNAMMNEYSQGAADFNDLVIAELCMKNQFTLLTDDADFNLPVSKGLSLMTANRRLLGNA